MKILLIEDDVEISGMLRDYLTTENFEVITAYDGKEACAKFSEDSYDIVLLDLMIPKISGMDVMQKIRTSSTVPIIILSAKDTDLDKTLGLGLGADDYTVCLHTSGRTNHDRNRQALYEPERLYSFEKWYCHPADG